MKSTGGFSTNKSWGKCWHATHEEWYSLSEWEVNLIYFPGWMCSNTFKKKLRFPCSCHCTHHILASQLETRLGAALNSWRTAPVSIAPSTELLTFPGKLTTLSTWKNIRVGSQLIKLSWVFFHQKKLSLQQIVSQNRPWEFFWVVQSCEKVYPTPRNLFYQWM